MRLLFSYYQNIQCDQKNFNWCSFFGLFFFWNTLYLNKKNPRPSTTPIYTLLTHESVQENTKINLSLTSNYNSKTEGRAERRIISFNDSVNWRYCRASMLDE